MIGSFVKTLFGDLSNVAVVAALLAVEAALIRSGFGWEAVFAARLRPWPV